MWKVYLNYLNFIGTLSTYNYLTLYYSTLYTLNY